MDRKDAEEEIFAIRRKMDLYARAGDVSEVNRLKLEIAQLQQKHNALFGVERNGNERGDNSGYGN